MIKRLRRKFILINLLLVGLVLLIAALAIYNKPFQDERRR
jgi:hypothetical protein